MKAPLSLTLFPTGAVVLSFEDAESRDDVLASLQRTVPRETHSTFRSGSDGETFTLSLRPQHTAKPIVIAFNEDDDSPLPAAAPAQVPSGTPTTSKLFAMDRDSVPGVNAEAHTEENATSSGFNLTGGVPGAINNDPATATNAGIEGSPAQAIQSAIEANGLARTPSPGGFAGPDKAAKVEGTGGNTVLPGLKAENFHPEGQKQDAGVVNVNRASDALGDPQGSKKEEPKPKPLPAAKPAPTGGKPQPAPAPVIAAPAPSAPSAPATPAPSTPAATDSAPATEKATTGTETAETAENTAKAE